MLLIMLPEEQDQTILLVLFRPTYRKLFINQQTKFLVIIGIEEKEV